jgi:hypothetical protein
MRPGNAHLVLNPRAALTIFVGMDTGTPELKAQAIVLSLGKVIVAP